MGHNDTAQVIRTDIHFTGSGAETLCLRAWFLLVRHGYLGGLLTLCRSLVKIEVLAIGLGVDVS